MEKPQEKSVKKFKAPERATIQAALDEAEKRREENGLEITGRKYLSVKDRVDIFRRFFGFDYGIITEVVCPDPMVKKGSPVKATCYIRDPDGTVVAMGTALEYVGSNEYTKTSPFEVAETSSIGRALASLGLHGGEFASANEVVVARALPSVGISMQKQEWPEDTGEMLEAVKKALETVHSPMDAVGLYENVTGHVKKLGLPDSIKAEIDTLFRMRIQFLKSKQHKEQQESLDGQNE